MAELKLCSLQVETEWAVARQQLQQPFRAQQAQPGPAYDDPSVSLAGEAHFFPLLDYSVQGQRDGGANSSLGFQLAGSAGARSPLGSGVMFHSPLRSPERRAAYESRAQLESLSPAAMPWAAHSFAVDQSMAAESLLIFPETILGLGRGSVVSPGYPLVGSLSSTQPSATPLPPPQMPQASVPEDSSEDPPYSDAAFDRFKTADVLPPGGVGSWLSAKLGMRTSLGVRASAVASSVASKQPVPFEYVDSARSKVKAEQHGAEPKGAEVRSSKANAASVRCVLLEESLT